MSQSSASAAAPQNITYCLLPRGAAAQLLLIPGEDGWSLPSVVSPEGGFKTVAALSRAFCAQWGAEATVLRRLGSDETRQVFALENHSPERAPTAGRWVGPEELVRLTLADPEHQALLAAWFAEVETGQVPPLRNAWERPGWLAEATAWIHRELDRFGMTPTGPVEQYRTWSISCLLQVATNDGGVFMKAVPPMFAPEPVLTQALADLYPGRVPDVLSINPERRWLLMREMEGHPLGTASAIEPWETAARQLAQMQIDLSRRTGWLRSLGCPDRGLELLAAQIDLLLADTAALAPPKGGLSREEIDRLRALAPHLKTTCAELADGPIPPSLVHGDLHAGNIMTAGDAVRIYDWTDGCIAHPFLDLVTLIPKEPLLSIPDACDRLRTAYLQAWTDFAPLADLIRLFEQAQLLGAFHQAISYQLITANIEARAEMAEGVPHFLRPLLRQTEAQTKH